MPVVDQSMAFGNMGDLTLLAVYSVMRGVDALVVFEARMK